MSETNDSSEPQEDSDATNDSSQPHEDSDARIIQQATSPNRGMFYFTEEDVELAAYLRRHAGHDLDQLSGDVCDLFFDGGQLAGNRSGYEVFRRSDYIARRANVRLSEFPLLVLWSNRTFVKIPLRSVAGEARQLTNTLRLVFDRLRDINGPLTPETARTLGAFAQDNGIREPITTGIILASQSVFRIAFLVFLVVALAVGLAGVFAAGQAVAALSAIFGLILIFVCFFFAWAFATGHFRPLEGPLAYVMYVFLGCLSALLMFGVLSSTGEIVGEQSGVHFRAGGALVGLLSIVVIGVWNERARRRDAVEVDVQTFSLNVLLYEVQGQACNAQGRLRLDVGGATYAADLDAMGASVFQGIPRKCFGMLGQFTIASESHVVDGPSKWKLNREASVMLKVKRRT